MSVEQFFHRQLPKLFSQRAQQFPEDVIFGFELDGNGGGVWQLSKIGSSIVITPPDKRPKDCQMRCHVQVFFEIINGRLSPIQAFTTGQLHLQGDVGLALRLQNTLGLNITDEV
jgi:putative sterol carrier protein